MSDAWELMPPSLAEVMPKLYSQDGKGKEATVLAKYFLPGTGWTWLATEYDPDENICFGYAHNSADPQNAELGYFSLTEMSEIRAGGIFRVERDLYWEPKTLREAIAALR